MKAIITCVNYDDYLSLTLPKNKEFFSETIVVTSENDFATHEICKKYDVSLIMTNKFFEKGAVFNKGKAINVGLESLDSQNWVCHLDADIILPENFKNIDTKQLNKNYIYGCARKMCPSKDAWEEFNKTGNCKEWLKLKAKYFKVGMTTIKHFVPIGYFQLFHMQANCLTIPPFYPECSNNAAESDVMFSLKFEKHKYLDMEVIHLPVVGDIQEGINWNGRQSPRFQ